MHKRAGWAASVLLWLACGRANDPSPTEPASAEPTPTDPLLVTLRCELVGFGAVYSTSLSIANPGGADVICDAAWSSISLRVPLRPDIELCVMDAAGVMTNDKFRSIVDQIEPLGLEHLYVAGGWRLDPHFAIAELSRLTTLKSLSIDLSNAAWGSRTDGAESTLDEPLPFEEWRTLTRLTRLAILGVYPGDVPDSDGAVRTLVADHPRLEELRLTDFRGLTDAGLREVSRLSELRLFSLEGKFWLWEDELVSVHPCIRDAGIAHLRALAELRVLYLQGCDQIGDASLASISEMPQLEVLAVEMNSQITTQGLAQLARLPRLSSLSLFQCKQLDDEGLAAVASISTLLELDVQECPSITHGGLGHVRRAFPACAINERPDAPMAFRPPLGSR